MSFLLAMAFEAVALFDRSRTTVVVSSSALSSSSHYSQLASIEARVAGRKQSEDVKDGNDAESEESIEELLLAAVAGGSSGGAGGGDYGSSITSSSRSRSNCSSTRSIDWSRSSSCASTYAFTDEGTALLRQRRRRRRAIRRRSQQVTSTFYQRTLLIQVFTVFATCSIIMILV